MGPDCRRACGLKCACPLMTRCPRLVAKVDLTQGSQAEEEIVRCRAQEQFLLIA